MHTFRGAAALAILNLFAAAGASAQGRANFPAVYQGSNSTATDSHLLVATVDLEQAYDDDVLGDSRATPQPSVQVSGTYTALVPQMTLQTHQRRLQVSAHGDSTVRHYPDFATTVASNYNVGAGVTAHAGRNTTLVFGQTASYAPAYLYGLFAGPAAGAPESAPAPTPDIGSTDYQTNPPR